MSRLACGIAGAIAVMPTTAARGHHRDRNPLLAFGKGSIRQLALVTAAVTAVLAVSPASASAATGRARASAMIGKARTSTTTVNWVAAAWSIRDINQQSPATASHFFNTPSSYLTGPQTTGLATDGLAASPVLWYASYAKFAADLRSGAITYPYHWVYYDPEFWSLTPLNEQQNPRAYLRMFARLAHAHGFQVIEAPARDLAQVSGSICPKLAGETLDRWYIRCGVARWASHYSDIYEVQDQSNTTNVSEYDWLFNNAQPQALSANPNIIVDCGLSTNKGTPSQMAAAAQSIHPNGFYITIISGAPPAIQAATQFFQDMQAAGY